MPAAHSSVASPPPARSLRQWLRRAAFPQPFAWERLLGLPAMGATREAQRLLEQGILPPAHRPVPIPAWMDQTVLRASLVADSPLWTHVSAAEREPFEQLQQTGQSQAEQWSPWFWAWSHHPDGLRAWGHALVRAWRYGHVPLARALLAAVPGEAWSRSQAVAILPWETLWRRPVTTQTDPPALMGAGTTGIDEGFRGDWRHTLALWADIQAWVEGSTQVVEEHLLPLLPLGVGGGTDYMGTNSDVYRWRAPQLEAWFGLDLPRPSAAWALWLTGFGTKPSNPWGNWLNEGFDPIEDRAVAEEKAWQALSTIQQHVPMPATVRQHLLEGWLHDARRDLNAWLDNPARLGLEDRWAQVLSSPWPPCGHPEGWAHAVATAAGVPALRARSLKKLSWSSLPAPLFSRRYEAQLPWEVFKNAWGQQLWNDPHHQAVEEWLRHQAASETLADALPAAASMEKRQRF